MRSACAPLLVLGSFLLISRDVGATPNPYKTVLVGDVASLVELSQKPARAGEQFKAPRFFARRVAGIGRVNFACPLQKLPPAVAVMSKQGKETLDHNVPNLFKCKARLNRGRGDTRVVTAALSIIRGKVQIQFGRFDSKRPAVYSITASAAKTRFLKANVHRTSQSRFLDKECESFPQLAQAVKVAKAQSAPSAPSLTSYRVLTVSTKADYEWYQKYGDASNAVIAGLFNSVEAIYQVQFGVRFLIVKQHVVTDNSEATPSNASALLGLFLKDPTNPFTLAPIPELFNEQVALKILFTGKVLEGTTVGLSYQGAACWSPRNAYALVRNIVDSINVTTLAHEVGHLVGAQHDAAGIMTSSIGLDRMFSDASAQQINNHLNAFPNCAPSQLLAENLANAKMTISRAATRDNRKIALRVSLVGLSGAPIAGEAVVLTVGKKQVIGATNSKGVFKYAFNRSSARNQKVVVTAGLLNLPTAPAQQLKVKVS
jgi:hypothetical protein